MDEKTWTVPERLTPQAIYEMAASYFMISRTIQVAVDLDLFTPLSRQPATAEELAKQLRVNPRGLETLLIACTALGLLEKKDGRFRVAPPAATLLVKGQAGYGGYLLAGSVGVYRDWLKLDQAIRTGRPVARPTTRKGKSSLRQFVLGMHTSSQGPARLLANLVDLHDKKRLLDVGGGAGTYAVILCQRYPQLTATVLDLPKVISVAREIIAQTGLSQRIQARVVDYTKDPFPEANDVVLLCNVLHQEDPPTCQMLLDKSYTALLSGGIVVILEVLLNDEKTGPLSVALGALNNLVHHHNGGAYSVAEIKDWIQEAGFGEIIQKSLPAPGMSLLLATKQ